MNLDFENRMVLEAIQASLGSISENVRFIGIDTTLDKKVSVYFILEKENELDREEIEEIAFSFNALQDHYTDMEFIVKIDSRPFSLITSELPNRAIYH